MTELDPLTEPLVHLFRRHDAAMPTDPVLRAAAGHWTEKRQGKVMPSHQDIGQLPGFILPHAFHAQLAINGDRHWIVTLAFAAQSSADANLAAIQRTAYLDFRDTVSALVAGERRARDAADREAERLIALVNGIALQALFAPDLWTEQRQVDALETGLAR